MEKINSLPFSFGLTTTYEIRKSGEKVEVIAFEQEEYGARSEKDWVSYIDSNGNEHIKENLNILFDLKPFWNYAKAFDKILDVDSAISSIWETRKYDLVKFFIEDGESVDSAISKANDVIDAIKKEPEFR